MRPVSVEAVAESAICTQRPSRGNAPKRDSYVKGLGSGDVIGFPRREMDVHQGREYQIVRRVQTVRER
jgi:hypothetical protein